MEGLFIVMLTMFVFAQYHPSLLTQMSPHCRCLVQYPKQRGPILTTLQLDFLLRALSVCSVDHPGSDVHLTVTHQT